MQQTLVAIFDNSTDAQDALEALVSSGFSRSDVHLSGSQRDDPANLTSGSSVDTDSGIGSSVKHFFSNLFGGDSADRYEGAVNRGQIVLTLATDSLPEAERAADIIECFNPTDIDENSDSVGMTETSGALLTGSQSAMGTSSMSAWSAPIEQREDLVTSSLQRDSATQSIPVVEEQLQVGKREIQRGGARIVSRIVETPVSESVELREEHVNVERRPVDQPITTADTDLFREQSIELRETVEEAVVRKSARIVEEVTVGKQVDERQEQITDTVRHTEVDVQRVDSTTGLGDANADCRNHFENHYDTSGSYDDYAPAYGYGSQMRGDARYSGRQWDDVESDLRTDWETRNTGTGSTWEKMKAAVRHGWDRMTDDNTDNRFD